MLRFLGFLMTASRVSSRCSPATRVRPHPHRGWFGSSGHGAKQAPTMQKAMTARTSISVVMTISYGLNHRPVSGRDKAGSQSTPG